MTNIKKKDFYNAINGDDAKKESYGLESSTFKKVVNVDMLFDSRGEYLGIRTFRGKLENNKLNMKKGISDFKSFLDLSIWKNQKCIHIAD